MAAIPPNPAQAASHHETTNSANNTTALDDKTKELAKQLFEGQAKIKKQQGIPFDCEAALKEWNAQRNLWKQLHGMNLNG